VITGLKADGYALTARWDISSACGVQKLRGIYQISLLHKPRAEIFRKRS